MKAHLLHPDQDFDLRQPLPWNHEALTQDLALDTLFDAMAQGDKFILEVVKPVVLTAFGNSIETIRYRQDVLQDCLAQASVVRELYALAVEAVEAEKKHYLGSTLARYPDWVLRYSMELIEALLGMTRKLRRLADQHAGRFVADGWTTFFSILAQDLTDDYFRNVQHHLERLKFRNGVLLSAELGKGNKGQHYILRRPPMPEGTWLTRLVAQVFPQETGFSFSLHPRDEGGARALSELRDRGIALVSNALAQSSDHVRSFFSMLRTELAFYVGCLNLHDALARKGERLQRPSPAAAERGQLSFRDLRDVCLILSMDRRVVGNDANANEQDLVIVTGANQGGKSTFLRSIGLAQLMMQSGMFVSAPSFHVSIRDGMFTHYKREEDTAMKSGKLDEELNRMSDIVDHLTPRCMILFNESFAATNEREGSEVARQIISALLGRGFKMVCVTHLYEFAHDFYTRNKDSVLFLRAERDVGGARTFKLLEAEPLGTSFGEDLYKGIFTPEQTGPGGVPARPVVPIK